MKLIENWQKAWKSYSVLLPFVATTIAVLVSLITSLISTGVVGVEASLFLGYVLTGLTYAGRIVQQVNLFIASTKNEEEDKEG